MTKNEIKLRNIIREIAINELDGSRLSVNMNEPVETNNPFIIAPVVVEAAGERKFKKTVDNAHVNVANSFKDRVERNREISNVRAEIERQIDDITVSAGDVDPSDVKQIEITEFDQLIEYGILTESQRTALIDSFAIEARESLLDGCLSAVGAPNEPTTRDYIKRVLASGTEMFTFGVVDNAVLIFAGDYIDGKLDGKLLKNVNVAGKYYQFVMVGFVAAGVGNAVSDGFGAAIAGPALEATGFTPENYVTNEQMENAPLFWRALDSLSGTIGVVVGCIVGILPAFFLDSYKTALAAAGYVWGAKTLAASTQVQLPFATGATKLATGVTATGAVAFTGAIIAVGTLAYGLASWATLTSAKSENNEKGLASHQRRVLIELGIKVGVHDDSDPKWRTEITNKDIALFKNAIDERPGEVQKSWHKHMHPTQIASDTDSYDIDHLYEAVEALSDAYGLDFPDNSRSINESRWQKLAGII